MNFLKNSLKIIIPFILGAILTGGIVYSATSANQVNYTISGKENINSVADALNDLYSQNNKNTKIYSLRQFQYGTYTLYTASEDCTATIIVDCFSRSFNVYYSILINGTKIKSGTVSEWYGSCLKEINYSLKQNDVVSIQMTGDKNANYTNIVAFIIVDE